MEMRRQGSVRNRPAVDLDIWGENQRGDTTTPGHAMILLPSREHGPVRLPEPPGGAQDDYDRAAQFLHQTLVAAIDELSPMSPEQLVEQRYQKFRQMGSFFTE